jgi:hypothetical protein
LLCTNVSLAKTAPHPALRATLPTGGRDKEDAAPSAASGGALPHPSPLWGRDERSSLFLIPPPCGVETSEARPSSSLPLVGRVAGRRPVGWGSVQRVQNAFHDASEIVIDIRIPEPKNPEALREEKCVANLIPLRAKKRSMLTSVGLDDEPGSERNEVHDVAADRHLSPKMKSERL